MIADLQLNYHAEQDRLQLILVVSGKERLFWLTRRQCLEILAAMRRAEGEPPPLKFAPPLSTSREQEKKSSKKDRPDVPGDAVQPEESSERQPQLVRLRLQNVPQGMRMALIPLSVTKAPQIRVMLKPLDQLALAKTLRHLGQRAQWDFSVAEPRELANALLMDVQRLR